MLYSVTNEWEHNGYHDSDWYVIAYDTEKDKVFQYETGTTRFADARRPVPPMAEGTILEAAKVAHIRDTLTDLCKQAHYQLSHRHLKVGETVMVERTFTTSVRPTCDKCNGSGHWVNPKRESDKRSCFGCWGKGFKKVAKDDRTRVTLRAGTIGKVVKLDCDADRYNREGFDKWFAFIQVDGQTHPVRAALSSMTRPAPEEGTFEKQARAFIENATQYAFYAPFKTGINCIF